MMTEPPEDDSPDLSDVELALAIPTGDPADMASYLRECPVCKVSGRGIKFKKLRRGVHFYSRVTMVCSNGHKSSWLFENTWYREMRP